MVSGVPSTLHCVLCCLAVLIFTLFSVVEGGFQYTPQFDRKSDPQVGSNTDYHNFSFIATEDINTGDEIFVGFGELERSDPQYADLPTWRDYDRADRIIDDLKKYHEIHPELSQTQWIGECWHTCAFT
jgi:hypothetical protein